MDSIFVNSENVKHLIFIDYYSIFLLKQTYKGVINMLLHYLYMQKYKHKQ